MNFFKLYPGDYQRDTGALSLAQHGAYLLMLQHYYATEQPLPVGASLYRLMRAQTKAEREAIDYVTARFWLLKDGALVNTRAVIEIERAVRQRDVNREIGKRGGRPRRTDNISEPKTDSVLESVTKQKPNDNPNQTPDTREEQEPRTSALRADVSAGADLRLVHSSPDVEKPESQRCPLRDIVALYHTELPSLPRVEKLTKAREGHLRQRWIEDLPTLDAWRNYFRDVAASDFLMGRTAGRDGRPPFRATLEWLTKPSNFAKVAEGNYHTEAA